MALGVGSQQSSNDPLIRDRLLQQTNPSAQMAASIGGIRPLTRDEVASEVENEIIDSIGAYGSPVHEQRRINIRRYYGKPLGNEVEGQSQAQVTTVADTIEWMQPSIMKAIFGSGANIWDFQPTRPGEEEMAEQASDAVNDIFINQCNGFNLIMDITKTANLEKRGYAAVYYDERMEPKRDTYRNISQEMLGFLMSDKNIELVEFSEHQGEVETDPQTGQPRETFDVTVKRLTPRGMIRIDSIPPEHMLIPRRETTLDDDTRFAGYRKRMTVGELISMGYDPEIVSMVPSDNKAEFTEGRVERLYDENSFPVNLQDRGDGASRQLWVNFIWMHLDEDGDGYAELRHIVCVGDSGITILDDREVNHTALVSLNPIPMPHKFHGMCPADQAVDLQVIQSTILRQMLDNQYRVNNGRWEAVEGAVNIKDLVDNKPGGVVRVAAPGMVSSLATPALPSYSFELLNFMEAMGERRTGVSSWQEGPDAADMKYQTAGAVSNVATASESRINLINRVFAETGIKDIGKKILQLLCENMMSAYTYRLRGKWVECDPRTWNADMDVRVRTGLGVGEMEMRAQKLIMIAGFQEKLLNAGLRQMVTPRNLYNTARELVKVTDLGAEGYFFTNPGDEPWPEPEPELADQVKVMESKRRALEDQNVDNQATMSLAVQASAQDEMGNFRYAELTQKGQLAVAQMHNQREIATMQMRAQIQSAMANRSQPSQ